MNGDLLVEITNRIDRIELRLDGLDKKIAGLARANVGTTQGNNGDMIQIESRMGDLENRFNAHLIDYENFKNDVFNALKSLQDQLNGKASLD